MVKYSLLIPQLVWAPAADIKSVKVMNTILDVETPDLVVLNGDLITGENTYFHNSTQYLDQIVQPMVQRSVPWASTYGNHDHEYNLSCSSILQRERTKYGSLSYTKNMVPSQGESLGTSNYVLPIYGESSHDSGNTTPVALLWFFDSKGGKEYQKFDGNGQKVPMDGFVHPSVVKWFKETNVALQSQAHGIIPSLVFVHIPVFAAAAFQRQGVDKFKEPGINDDNPLASQAIKNNVYTGEDVPFMQALADTKGLKAVFSGHDHGDDWCFRWDSTLPGMDVAGTGLSVCFGRHTGYGGYGTWTRGSRQILLRKETLAEEVESWVRLEDGESSGWVTLNGTYGKDPYPVVEKKIENPASKVEMP
jgi:hypothetical protein